MTRQAISPRLAIRILRNIRSELWHEIAISPKYPAIFSQRDVVVLFGWAVQLLAAQHRERPAQAAPGVARLDHVVDKAAARRDKRIGEFLAIFFRARLDRRGIAEIGAKDDLDRAFGPHHRDLGRGPGEIEITAQML